ncbi:hypothetical protein BVX97_02340 [bacterium E08(2017)]|nr:hypothetical protein BVX97_02340 [bacterium E08(2017)]
MNRRLFVYLASAFCLLNHAILASNSSEPPLHASRFTLHAPPPHPRIIFPGSETVAVKKKIADDKLLAKAHDKLIDIADKTINEKPVKRVMTGRRLLHVSRKCLDRVLNLSYAYRMTGDKKYAVRAQKEMLAAASFSDWNPNHFLDVAEMTAALAMGYDWCYDTLDPTARQTIRQAIVEKGLMPSLKGGFWVSGINNWNQVCHGGLTLGALAVMEDEQELARKIITRAVKNLPNAIHEYQPHGAYPEGPGYWVYGTSYNVAFLAAVESVLGTDFGLASLPGFMESADFYLHATGPTGPYFNYADGSAGNTYHLTPIVFWFAQKRNDPYLLWFQKKALEKIVSKTSIDRFSPLITIWSPPLDDIPEPTMNHWRADGTNPIGMHRSGWGHDAIYTAIKAGSPSAPHAHMDIGSFVMHADGIVWGIDLGAQNYHSLESKGIKLWGRAQDSERWTVFRLNNLSHNTIVADGKPQITKGKAEITSFSSKGDMPGTVIDMTTVYEGQFTKAQRGVFLYKDSSVVVQDELTTPNQDTSIRWGMVTKANIKIKGNRATLKQDGERLTLEVIEPEHVKLETFETENPPRKHDVKNPGTKMIGFKTNIPASTTKRLLVVLTPGKKSILPAQLPEQ